MGKRETSPRKEKIFIRSKRTSNENLKSYAESPPSHSVSDEKHSTEEEFKTESDSSKNHSSSSKENSHSEGESSSEENSLSKKKDKSKNHSSLREKDSLSAKKLKPRRSAKHGTKRSRDKKVKSYAESSHNESSEEEKKRRNDKSDNSGSSSEKDELALNKHKNEKTSGTKRKSSIRTRDKKVESYKESSHSESPDGEKVKRNAKSNESDSSSEEDQSALKIHKDKEASVKKRKLSTLSPSKKVKPRKESLANNSSSDEDNLLPTEERNMDISAIQVSKESNPGVSKDRSKKETKSEKRKSTNSYNTVKVSLSEIKSGKPAKDVSSNPTNTDATFSDESSRGLPDIEKVFETLRKESAGEKISSSFTSKRGDGETENDLEKADVTLTTPSKVKAKSKGKNSKLDKLSTPKAGAKDKTKKMKTVASGKKSDLNKSSLSKDKISEHSQPIESSISASEENDSIAHKDIEVNNATDKESPTNDKKKRSVNTTTSDSGMKKSRGRPRKPKLPAILEPSKDNSKSQTEAPASRLEENEQVQNDSERQSTEKEIASNPVDKSMTEAESPLVYAVKSKPSPSKRKKKESQKKSNNQLKTSNHSDPKQSSSADGKSDAAFVSDRNNSENKRLSKDSGKGTSTIKTADKRKSIYTSSEDSSDSMEMSPKDAVKGKSKKVKREFSCHKCSAKFDRTQQLFDHICDGKRDKGFACENCDKIYKLRSTYINHKIIHSKKKPYKCGICEKKSSSQSNHLYHMKNFHPEEKPFPCEFGFCEESFLTRRDQVDHQKTHKRFICTYCDEEFLKNSTLLHHKYKVHEIFFS